LQHAFCCASASRLFCGTEPLAIHVEKRTRKAECGVATYPICPNCPWQSLALGRLASGHALALERWNTLVFTLQVPFST